MTVHIRAVFMAYWSQSQPSAEVFWFTRPLDGTQAAITEYEQAARAALNAHSGRNTATGLVLLPGSDTVKMTDAEIAEAGWRIIGDNGLPLVYGRTSHTPPFTPAPGPPASLRPGPAVPPDPSAPQYPGLPPGVNPMSPYGEPIPHVWTGTGPWRR